jgi:beta-lactam-binding protein with PASTA domain
VRKLVVILIAFFAVVTFMRVFAGTDNTAVPVVIEHGETD